MSTRTVVAVGKLGPKFAYKVSSTIGMVYPINDGTITHLPTRDYRGNCETYTRGLFAFSDGLTFTGDDDRSGFAL